MSHCEALPRTEPFPACGAVCVPAAENALHCTTTRCSCHESMCVLTGTPIPGPQPTLSAPTPWGFVPDPSILACMPCGLQMTAMSGMPCAHIYLIIFHVQLQGITQEQFEAIKPDFARLQAASTDKAVFAVAITVPADEEGGARLRALC